MWKKRVSPVFDVSKHLLLVDVENSTEVARFEKRIDEDYLVSRARCVAELGVKILICGAVSRPLRLVLESKGIEVIGEVCGNTEDVLRNFLEGTIDNPAFRMPGCEVAREDFLALSESRGNCLKSKEPHMRVAVTAKGPDLTCLIDPKFGRARYLLLVALETEQVTALDNRHNLNAAQGAGIGAAKTIVNAGAEAVLTGHIGPKALEALAAARVQVFLGASGTVKHALNELKSGRLKSTPPTTVP